MLRRFGLPALYLLVLGSLSIFYFSSSSRAQSGARARVLITQNIEEGRLATLNGNTRPEATSGTDLGPVANDLRMEHMLLQLRRPPEQEQALQKFIDGLHDPTSPNFHKWLTPQQFGETFGLSQQDLDTITGWLQSFGFTVNVVYPSGILIDFSGTAGEVEQAFHTEVHNLDVNGEKHIANMRDPQIPVALAPAVVGVVSLHDFRPHAMHKMRGDYTFSSHRNTELAVVPADLATIYNLNPLFSEGITGQGQTVAVIEDTDVYHATDWNTFRSTFGLSAYTSGSFTQVHPAPTGTGSNCSDPGVNGDDLEAILDAEYASAAAPGAAIELASCSDTETTFGSIAAQNLINGIKTPPAIMSISYGECEAENGATANEAYNSTYQQAVSEGVSVFVAAGDEGAASCDADLSNATHGIGVSGYASTPYNVAVGGTDFGDTYAGTNSTYWNSSNTSTYGSAKSYIPEIPWNDSCASALIATVEGYDTTYGSGSFCNSSTAQLNGWLSTASGSGGPSGCATGAPSKTGVVGGTCAGYGKPSWQSVVGNPSDGLRDIPDVSLFAANGVWGHFYIFCDSDTANGGAACTGAPSKWSGAGGTSFASPIMAGIQALVNQKMGGSQGNPNTVYYNLAAGEYGLSGKSTCNSSIAGGPASSCVFYDVTLGDMDLNCTGSNSCYDPSGTYGVLSTFDNADDTAYGTATGWDFATGIGTVNAYNLVNNWPTVGAPNYTLSASPNSLTISRGSNGSATITVNPQNGFTGSVNLSASGLPSGVTGSFNPATATTTSTLTLTASSTAVIGTSTVTITGTSGSLSQTTTVSLTVPPALQSLSLNPTAVNGGTSSTGTVTLSGAAPSWGASVTLSSNNATATVPASVTVAANATTATFTITTSAVSAVTPVTISGVYNGGTPQSATLTVNNPVITSVASGSITTSGATITWTTNVTASSQVEYGTTTSYGTLSTLNSSLVTSHSVALTGLIASTLYHYRVHSTDGAGNAAVSGDFTFTTSTPPPVTLSSVTVNPTSVNGGMSSTGTVTLSGAAPSGGVSVTLSSNSVVATVPSSVTVAAGATTANFLVTTSVVTSIASATITATYSGVQQTATLGVFPSLPTIASVTLNPQILTGGIASTGTVTLSFAAPAGGALVTLSGNDETVAIVDGSTTVAAGATTATFNVFTNSVNTVTPVTITGSYNGTQSTTLIVNPAGISLVSIWDNSATPLHIDSQPVITPGEYGMRFTSDSNGYILGVRFYKGPSNVGTHVGNLWSSAGQLLATATFTAETASGWQQVLFSNPVQITANTDYIASYYNPTGDFSYTDFYFALGSGADNAPLHAPPDSVGAPNGVFASGPSSSFPNNTYDSYNYWVDVIFDPTPTNLTMTTPYLADGFETGFYFQNLGASGGTQPYTWTLAPGSSMPPGLSLTPAGLISGTATGIDLYNFTVELTDSSPSPQTITQPLGIYFAPAGTCPCTIWPSDITPLYADSSATTPGEFGVHFHADSDGDVVGIRFYKGPLNTGTHVGNLWSNSGQLLATATFTGETASGWQQVNFSSPVHITANTEYVASYYSPTGDYSYTDFYFALGSGADNAPLHAPPDTQSTPDGVYAYGATSSFPSNTFNSYNYWVDLVFNAIPGPTLASVSINPSPVTGGSTTTGTVTLSGPAPTGGETVSLASTNSGVISAPATVTVLAGATSATFTVTTYPMIYPTAASIIATGNGIQSGSVTVNPPSLASISLNPTTVVGGTSSTATVTLDGPAPIGGWLVTLSSSSPSATVPNSVTVPFGSSSATFTVTTTAVTSATQATISGTVGVLQSAILTIN